ncbi:hypothetical protein SEA_KIKO_8 [Gordonia phage Kiko]|nr:hypothetical protein SEA_KIKO_8 [Gordonia phage Kiko]
MTYRVTAPLVIAPDDDGKLHYHYEGAEIESISDEAAKRFVADGLIEKLKAPRAAAPKPAAKSTPAKKAGADAKPTGVPAFTAPDEDWVTYAIEQGMDPEDAKTTPRQDLIAKFAQQ